jgi:hypothetical protein
VKRKEEEKLVSDKKTVRSFVGIPGTTNFVFALKREMLCVSMPAYNMFDRMSIISSSSWLSGSVHKCTRAERGLGPFNNQSHVTEAAVSELPDRQKHVKHLSI